jgi:hypothetical protein
MNKSEKKILRVRPQESRVYLMLPRNWTQKVMRKTGAGSLSENQCAD